MRVIILLNSKIKRKLQVYENLLKLGSSQVATSLEILETNYSGHAIELAKENSSKCDCIIAAGGDGTLNEAVNGIMLSGLNKTNYPILAHFPCGSANDYARCVNIDNNIEQLTELLRKQHTHPIDIGKVTFTNENSEEIIRYFVNILDCGIGADVVKKINQSNKTLGVNFTFVRAILSSLLTYQRSTIKVKTEKEVFEEKILSQVFAIGKYFGNGLCIAPNAKPDNGIFESVTVGDIGMTEYIKNLRKLKKGKRIFHPHLTYRKCLTAEVQPFEYSCSIEADGEFLGIAPFKVEMKMHELKLLCDQFPKE